MGKYFKGIPEDFALSVTRQLHLKCFIETGTYKGATALWAAEHFDTVFTCELMEKIVPSDIFDGLPNVYLFPGDSRDVLPFMLKVCPDRALIWLDAHWSHDLKYKRPGRGECPLLDELRIICEDKRKHFILIDDARYFYGSPPYPHITSDWPDLSDIIQTVMHKYSVQHEQDLDIIVCS